MCRALSSPPAGSSRASTTPAGSTRRSATNHRRTSRNSTMLPEANRQRRGWPKLSSFSGLLASSGSLVTPLHRWRGEKRNHIRHHQPQKPNRPQSRASLSSIGTARSAVLAPGSHFLTFLRKWRENGTKWLDSDACRAEMDRWHWFARCGSATERPRVLQYRWEHVRPRCSGQWRDHLGPPEQLSVNPRRP